MNNGAVLLESFQKLDAWIERNEWKGYEPFDGLRAKYLRPLTFNSKYLRMALQQGVRRFPINLRPLLGISKETSSQGMGYFAKGYLNMHQLYGDTEYLDKALFCLDWLMSNQALGYSGACWGDHFDYQSRLFYTPGGIPTLVWTAHIANAFLDAFELLGDKQYLAVARSSCDFILKDLSQYKSDDYVCIGYIPGDSADNNQVHNANMLGASLLSRVYRITGETELLQLAKKAIKYTVERQRSDGAWYYAEDASSKWSHNFHWIDNFHTGYILDSLYQYAIYTNEQTYRENLAKGFTFYLRNFFVNDGTPKYYDTKTYPIDIQCAAQSIETLVLLRELDESSLELAQKVAAWTIENMQSPDGHFYFRKYKSGIMNKTPTLHWGQATMLSAIAALLRNTQSGASPRGH